MVFTPPSVPPFAGDRNLREEEGNRLGLMGDRMAVAGGELIMQKKNSQSVANEGGGDRSGVIIKLTNYERKKYLTMS